MRVRPSGRLLSVRNNPTGSLVTGKPAEQKATSDHDVSLIGLGPSCKQGCKCHRRPSTWEPQWHWWGMGTQRFNRSLRPTATHTASSSSRRPQEAMSKAKSQSPVWGEDAARNDAWWCVGFKLASISALSFSTRGRSQNGCLVGKTFGTSPNCADQSDNMTANRRDLTWHSQTVCRPGETVCSYSRSHEGRNCQRWHASDY